MLVSLVINCDTRSGFQENNTVATTMFNGCVSEDFLSDGIFNKIKLFDGFDKEVIVFVDEHCPVPESTLAYLRSITNALIIRKHTNEPLFNDMNYLSAISMARGDYIAKFDQDTAAFTSGKEPIEEMISLLDKYDYVSYPSMWSPRAVNDPSFDYDWASTRFFMCKRETIEVTDAKTCLLDNDFFYGQYPASRRCPWLEHYLGLSAKYNGNGVYYPPVDFNKMAIFSWSSYERWTLRRLNEYNYEQVKEWLRTHPLKYPNDIDA